MSLNPEFKKIGYDIIGSAFAVRNEVGRGLREKFYEATLAWEIRQRGYDVKQQVLVRAVYKGVEVMDAFQADILVDDSVFIETKAIAQFGEEEVRQLYTYMKLAGKKLGYIINFGACNFKPGSFTKEEPPYRFGIYRLVNGI